MYIIGLIVGGLVIGLLGRLLVPGRQPLGCVVTTLVGIAGSLLGGLLGEALFNRPGGFVLGVLCAAAIVFALDRLGPRSLR